MKLRARSATTADGGVAGPARVDRRWSAVLDGVRAGDVAIIERGDLDRGDAEALLSAGVVAVVNAAPFSSGRYPNLGPQLLARAGVVLVEATGPLPFGRLRDGTRVRVHDGVVYAGGRPVLNGRQLTLADVEAAMDRAREGLTAQLDSLTHNAAELLRREQDLLLHGSGIPDVGVDLRGRPVVVVVRDHDWQHQLRRLRRWRRTHHPVLVGVDQGADALLEAGLRPDVVVVGREGLQPAAGAPVSDRALTTARSVLLHADASDRLPGAERLARMGVQAARVATAAATPDVALLAADQHGAAAVVTVGLHEELDELLDQRRDGAASAFLTRLRVGARLVDARTVPQLAAGRRPGEAVLALLLVLLGVLAVALAVAATPQGAVWADDLGAEVEQLTDRVRAALT